MIPLRITMKGFLSYGDEQVLDLTDLPLCMLSGRNGTGKSSVFDALTFALFGKHRNGAQRNEDLINKQSDTAAVDLEFSCNGGIHSIRRTVQRKADGTAKPVTTLLRRKDVARDVWEPVPDTSTRDSVNAWVEQHVGLTADTFTSSTLLRQGQADRLLNSKPAEKSELLASAVGLEQYKKLHELADGKRKTRDATLKTVAAQLAGETPVSEEQVNAAIETSHAAAAALELADAVVERLQPLVQQSRSWAEWTARLKNAEAERKGHDLLLSRAGELETDWTRLCELRGVVASLKTIVDQRVRLEASAKKVDGASAKRAAAEKNRAELETQLSNLREACRTLTDQIILQDQRHRDVEKRLAELVVILTHAATLERQQRDLADKQKQRAKFPPDAAKLRDAARKEVERLADLGTALPTLHRLDQDRAAVGEVHARLKGIELETKQAAQEITGAAAAVLAAQKDLDQVDAVHGTAQAEDARAAAELKLIRADLKELAKIDGHADCPTCGQELSAEHRKKEQARRTKNEKEAKKACAEAAAALQSAVDEQKRLRGLKTTAERHHNDLQSRGKAREQIARQCGEELARRLKDCAGSHGKLPESFRTRIGTLPASRTVTADDWAATRWPEAADLQALDQEAGKLAGAKKSLEQAECAWSTCQQLDAHIQMLDAALKTSAADQQADVKPLRDEQEVLTGEQNVLQQALQTARVNYQHERKTLESLEKQIAQSARDISALDAEISAEKARQDGSREAIALATAALPAAWAPAAASADAAALTALDKEQQKLETAKVEADFKLLQAARSKVVALEQQIQTLKSDIDALPSEARVDPDVIANKVAEAKGEQALRRSELHKAEADQQALKTRRQRRLELELQYQAAERELGHYTRLSKLLGREQLQRHLMRKAEGQIVLFANAVLDRISEGGLMLRLRPPEEADPANPGADAGPERVLDLQAFHRRTSQDALNTAFLSGSQQFRVAVSLALAFGQYARGGKGLGECVIIDEGFGSLDREGQEVMIGELQRLQGIMQRIILVSHQESFAEKFPHGYQFTLENGQTRVARITA